MDLWTLPGPTGIILAADPQRCVNVHTEYPLIHTGHTAHTYTVCARTHAVDTQAYTHRESCGHMTTSRSSHTLTHTQYGKKHS